MDKRTLRNKAIQLIILFGMISLFGDVIYEGARSVNGPYLKTLGANAAMVGLIAGLGELLGYAIRLVSGYFSDKTKSYWAFTFIGYGMLASVPLMALTGLWQTAAFFILAERLGKALRSPAKDTIVSQATKQIGTGFGFGMLEVLDQIGAMTGPLIFTLLFMTTGVAVKTLSDYQAGYALFWILFLILMIFVTYAYVKVPSPEILEKAAESTKRPDKLSKVFWLYTAFSFVATAGLVNFVLIAYHFKTHGIMSDAQIPLFYGLGMGVDAIAALAIGYIYDRMKNKHKNDLAGLLTLIIIPVLTGIVSVCAFSNNLGLAVLSVLLWGVVMGAHETVMRSAIADLTPLKKRGTGYGIFNTSYGIAMFFSAALMGLLYDISIPAIIILSVALELIAIPLFIAMKGEALKEA